MNPDVRELYEAAIAVQAHSYSPYSHFRVGAALRTASGRIFVGCNVENAAYPQSSCAEASAISALISAGERRFVEAVVVADGDDESTCCGGCRQRIREFADQDVQIHFGGANGLWGSMTVAELLPRSFGPENLIGFGGDDAAGTSTSR
jgi:cytidine deaminase